MQHLYDVDSLDLVSGFGGMLWQPFYPLLMKEPKDLCFSPADKNIAQPIQYTVRLAYYKQSYCKDIQIYLIFRTLEG